MKLFVYTDELKYCTNKVDEDIDEFVDGILSTKNILNDLGNSWQGADYNLFKEKLEGFITELNKFEKSVQSYNDYVKKFNKRFIELDNRYGDTNIALR